MTTLFQDTRILALVGSFRKGSFNRRIYENYARIAESFDSYRIKVSEGKYEDFPFYNDDVREQGMPEPVLRLAEEIRAADGLIFFSPEYNYSVPGTLKNALDWLSRVPAHPPLAGKPCSMISASPGRLGGARMQYHLRQIGVFLDLRIMNRPEIMISEVNKKLNDQGQLVDAETEKHLHNHLGKFVQFIHKGQDEKRID